MTAAVDEDEDAVVNEDVNLNDDDFLNLPDILIPPKADDVQIGHANGPRLIIYNIMNENFKSYVGKNYLGPFHKNFTSIIGANGSGKSNVIDSMLFVFGSRASKLRSSKISVLIHNSEHFPNLDSCCVEIIFIKIIDTGEGDADYQTVLNSELVVARTAFKDNSSFYTVNGRRMKHKEVAQLLMKEGIDLTHNRFLILQGEVEQISLMKPIASNPNEEGLLEYIEDIIGSSRFIEPLERIGKRIEQLNEYRLEHTNQVSAVDKQKKALEGSRDEAILYLQLCNSVTNKKNILFHIYLQAATKLVSTLTESKEAIEEELNTVKSGLAELNECKQKKLKEDNEVVRLYREHTNFFETTKKRLEEIELEDTKLREEHKQYRLQGKRAKKNLEETRKEIEDFKTAPQDAEEKLKMLDEKLQLLETQRQKEDKNLETAMQAIRAETAEYQVEKEREEKVLSELQEDVNQKKSERDIIKSELDILLSNHQRELTRLGNAETEFKQLTEQMKAKENQLKETTTELPRITNSLDNGKRDLRMFEEREHVLQEELRELRGKTEEARSAMQADSSQNRVLSALMEEKRKGRFPGLLGRLGDLGAIGEKYDVAMSTACGPLDNLVVDVMETAQKCLQFVKDNKLGTVTFIALDKMEQWKHKANEKGQFPIPRLFDLVTVEDNRVRNAFYFALRDTLVASDNDEATRIAYGSTRYRVVSLQGSLIELSGTFSGGGGRAARGRIGRTVKTRTSNAATEASADRLEAQLAEKSQELRNIREQKAKVDESVQKLSRDHKQLVRNSETLKLDLGRIGSQLKVLEETLANAKKRVADTKPNDKTVKQMEVKVKAADDLLSKSEEKARKVEVKVNNLHEKIMDIGGSKLQAIKSKLKEFTSEITKHRNTQSKIKTLVKTAERKLVQAEEKVTQLEQETEECRQNVDRLAASLSEHEQQFADLIKKHNEAQEKVGEWQKLLEEVKKEMTDLEKKEHELKKTQMDVRQRCDEVLVNLDAAAKKKKLWEKDISKLKLHEIDDDDLNDESQLEASQDEGIAQGPDPNADVSQTEEDAVPASISTLPNKKDKYILKAYTEDELTGYQSAALQNEVSELEDRVQRMTPDMGALEEYRRKEQIYLSKVVKLNQVTQVRDGQRVLQEQWKKDRTVEFMTGFHFITGKLKEMYQMITIGGDAELELVNSLDPFSEGIVFSVRPPKKSWKNIVNLSGGEKTLSSLALVFALHRYKPTPLYFMDEIDAALDFKNVSIVANYIKERTRNAQFIIISLRSDMYELADRLVGIMKTNNTTKTVTIDPRAVAKNARWVNALNAKVNSHQINARFQSQAAAAATAQKLSSEQGGLTQEEVVVSGGGDKPHETDDNIEMMEIIEATP